MYNYVKVSIDKKHKIKIILNGEILPGSISSSYLRCGRKNCSCQGSKLHGPYFRWTGFIDNKRTSVTISENVALECLKRIDNYKKLMAKIEKLKIKALANAPWLDSS